MNKKIYLCKINPEEYPEYTRRTAPAVTRDALGGRIQFTSLRGFDWENTQEPPSAGQDAAITKNNNSGKIKDFGQLIDMYVRHFGLGKVLWPVYPTLFAENFDQLVELCVREGLYLYDFWGYVPGSKPSRDSIWGEYAIPKQADRIMRERLGSHFLGYDNGEQDGRYIGYASRSVPLADCRRKQYINFQKYFGKLFDAMLNHTVTLASLTFLHYFAKEGSSIMLGAETAQALPSSPMWFSFIRGAGKQYGLLWYGNASVWNRWGYKDYIVDSKEPDTSNGYEMGRFAGTSLGLLKRLIYNHYMYNCNILGFENGWFTSADTALSGADVKKDEKSYIIGNKRSILTPIGEIQRECVKFTERYPDPGVMYTPLAIVADFFAGWVPPRHLYTGDIYKVWGSLPYNNGDYQLHALLTMLYPGYENAGFYRDERGFDPPAPFGEIADVLLSDIHTEILNRYAAAVILSSVELTLELYLKLKAYVKGGGKIVVFADMISKHAELSKYDPDYFDFFGIKDLQELQYNNGVLKNTCHKGTVAVVLNKDGLTVSGDFSSENKINLPIARPFSFTPEIEKFFEGEFSDLSILSVNNKNLRYCVNILKAGKEGKNEYTLYVANSNFREEYFDIICRGGLIVKAKMLDISDSVNKCEEYLPLLREEGGDTGNKNYPGKYMINPGDCQIWRVAAEDNLLDIYPESLPAEQKKQLFLKISPHTSVKDFLLEHPTFLHHFKGVMAEAEYFDKLDKGAAKKEAHYLKLQKIRLIVDFSGMINHFPDFSLLWNLPERTKESIRKIVEILDKARLCGAEAAVFTSHRQAENEYTPEQARDGLKKSFDQIEKICAERGMTMYVQNRSGTLHSPGEIKDMVNHYAVNTAYAQAEGYDYAKDLHSASLLLLSSAISDKFGQYYAVSKPVCLSALKDDLKSCYDIAVGKDIPVVMSASYDNWDEVVYDLFFLK